MATLEKDSWQAAKAAYQKALVLYQTMKAKGTFASADAAKPDEIAREIAKCDGTLR